MIKQYLPLIFTLLVTTAGSAQHQFWRDVSVAPATERSEDDPVEISSYRTVAIDLEAFKGFLAGAPDEGAAAAGRSPMALSFPLPDGRVETFLVVRSSVMMPRLAAKYPEIQSFRLIGTERASSSGRFTYGTNGFSAVLRTRAGEVFIDGLPAGSEELYRVYFGRDVLLEGSRIGPLSCGASPDMFAESLEVEEWEAERPLGGARSGTEPVDVHVYSVALACTGEYAQNHGGTVESVLSSFNEALSMLNQVYESEVAIRFVLIEDVEKLIWLDPQTDPFVTANLGRSLLNQIGDAFTTNAKITLTSFDLGHLFTGNCIDQIGGVAQGRACNFGRERGVTCHSSSNVNVMVRRVMTHEVGHQFSASHTFTYCPTGDNQSQVAPSTALEPGSGSTIMSYAGGCGSQNVAGDNDPYFHTRSLEQIINYTRIGAGRNCATRISVDNTEPVAIVNYASGFYIPVSTPFQLTGAGTDMEDEELTFCWEELDIGPLVPLEEPEGNTPLFRSFPPSTSSTRVFPRIENLLTGSSSRNEVLPDYARDLSFRMTVRDNHPGGGAVSWEKVNFKTTDEAGPFVVLSPDTDRPMWEAGTYQQVIWEVANTDRAPVNCQWVNILLSTDGGYNYPIVLATGVPNTGSAMVAVPNIETVAARIKVEANENIFFNISSQNFRITQPQTPGFTLSPSRNFQDVCLPGMVNVDLETQGFLGFEEDITFELIDGLPQGANFAVSPETIEPGETAMLNISIPDFGNAGDYKVRYRALVPGVDTVEQTLYLTVISNDFSEVELLLPPDGTEGIGLTTLFSWTTSDNASQYVVELANDPRFTDPFLLEREVLDENATQFQPDILLEENTLHYWRLRPVNECGEGEYSAVNTFHTETLVCSEFEATDTPVIIPGSGLPTKESVISIDFDGVISDVNIPIIKGNYQPVSSLRMSLISPAGTEVILFDENCGNTTDLLIGFDDQAPDTLICPPDDGIVFRPVDSLAAFIGESTRGDWTLRVKVVSAGFGGVGNIGEWKLEFCAKSNPVDPVLVTNDTLYVPPGKANPVMASVLEVQDEDNGPGELKYTLVKVPRVGTLYHSEAPLSVGDTFNQTTINAINLFYVNEDPNVVLDSFIFVVEDGTGGWIAPQTFTIKMDNNATVDTEDPERLSEIRLFPNPTRANFRLQLPVPLEQQAQLSLFDARGSLVQQQPLAIGVQETSVEVSHLPRGVYFVRLQAGSAVLTRRLVVQ